MFLLEVFPGMIQLLYPGIRGAGTSIGWQLEPGLRVKMSAHGVAESSRKECSNSSFGYLRGTAHGCDAGKKNGP